MSFWTNKRFVVTGGAGFLGRHVVEQLRARGCKQVFVPRSKDYDLRDKEAVARLLEETKPHILIHLSAVVGGIGANQLHPGKFFYDNAIMGIQLIEEARRFQVEKLVCVGTVCSYPKSPPIPFREEDIWNGYPEETNAPYGLAKRMLLVQLQAYRQEYGFDGIYLIPVNLFGPWDNFDLETSHVIPAMMRKFVEARKAGDPYVTLWGTGKASREFLYVEDCAEGILLATERYDGAEPVNLGTGEEVTIAELAEKVRATVGYEGDIVWDASRPDGQPRRQLDVTRAREMFGFVARTGLEEGLSRTLEWYRNQVKTERSRARS